MQIAKFDSDNLIYNRYDLIFKEKYDKRNYTFDGIDYEIMMHNDDGEVSLNLWGKMLPQPLFEQIIEEIFQDRSVYSIKLNRCQNNYKNYLVDNNDIRVPLSEDPDDILLRVERRDRATIRRKQRWLDERVGTVSLEIRGLENIPDEWVLKYFEWKKDSHNTNYRMTAHEYLEKYYVSDAMLLKAGTNDIAIAFWCENKDIVFFENFSYNPDYRDYSPGLLIYVKLLEELCRRKCRYLYLGGGNYIYKKRFNSEEVNSYSGIIYRKEFVNIINKYYSNKAIKNVAIYGYGVCGKEFMQISNELDIGVKYAIDKTAIQDESVTIVRPDEDWPQVDSIIITLNSHIDEVEELVKKKHNNTTYWIDDRKVLIEKFKEENDLL